MNCELPKSLIVLLGPTGIGKTELSLNLAEAFDCPILNCDSRQLFRGIEIGTAAPTVAEQQRVKHNFVGTLNVGDYYSAAQYEAEAMALLEELFQKRDIAILSGGSMMYIDAVCKGIDDIPTVDDDTRQLMKQRLENEGLESLLEELRQLDPEYHAIVDPHNTRRIVHALEICHMTGKTYTSFRIRNHKQRPFRIIKIGLQRPREELFHRINQRVEEMVQQGLVDEVIRNLPHRAFNSLNTVGFKEIFEYLDNKDLPAEERRALQFKGRVTTLQEAVERIKKNTRVYAKKQMTWFAKDDEINWFHPSEAEKIKDFIKKGIHEENLD